MEPIVVGIDGSDQADRAVSWAASDALCKGSPLHIVHGHRSPNGRPGAAAEVERLLVMAKSRAAEGRPGLAVTAEWTIDRPEIALATHAKRSAEIVIGHRGRDGFQGLLLGSVGLRLAGQVPGPVVVVRGTLGQVHGTVAVGIDAFAVSEAALDYACRTAAASGSRLVVVEVWQPPAANSAFTKHVVADAAEQLSRLMRPWRDRFPELPIEEKIILGRPLKVLVGLSAEVDLLVVGSRGMHTVQSAIMGSVSHGVMHYAHCPVAVVRPRSSLNGKVVRATATSSR